MLPGPVSNAITSSGFASGGIAVIFAMPPIFSATRPSFAVAIQQVIDERHQRRAVSSRRHIARCESRTRRECRSAPPAPIRRRSAACCPRSWKIVCPWQPISSMLSSGTPQLLHSLRVELRQQEVQPRDLGSMRLRSSKPRGCARAPRPGTESVSIRRRRRSCRPLDIDHRDVDAVERRAAHDARNSHSRPSSCCNSASSFSASIGRSSSTLSRRMRSAIS